MTYKEIYEAKRETFCTLAECMSKISCVFEKLSKSCRPELFELIDVLESEQNDLNFANEEADAIGKYFSSKGYDKQTMEFMITRIMNYWN